jgi:hypothetical protein
MKQVHSLDVTPRNIYKSDILLRSFYKSRNYFPLAAIILYWGLCFGLGWFISSAYSTNAHPVLPIYDTKELPYAILVYIIGLPIIALFYAREPRSILGIFEALLRKDVLVASPEELNQFLTKEFSSYGVF